MLILLLFIVFRKVQLPNRTLLKIFSDIEEIYNEFMSFSWTEDRHEYLKELSPEVAKKLLRCLSSEDLEVVVNHRRCQEAYIGDYLDDLWYLDEESFWEHIGKAFESPDGMLVYDNDAHIQVMSSQDMPHKVWMQLLHSLLGAYRTYLSAQTMDYELEFLKDVIFFQTEKSTARLEKRDSLKEWFEKLAGEDKELTFWFFEIIYQNRTIPFSWDKSA